MRKILSLLCAVFIVLLLPAAYLLANRLPADTQPYVEQKYQSWSGVLRGWICMEWEPGGSFIRWLNNCAARFEKAHEGVYLEFTPVTAEAMRQMHTVGIRPPELIFFSPGVILDFSALTAPPGDESLRSDLSHYAQGRALPLALGAAIWAVNPDLGDFPPGTMPITMLPDEPGCNFSAALIGLLSSDPSDVEPESGGAGIDLGLPASTAQEGILRTPDALDLFIDGKLSALPVTQKEIARLTRLRESGRGPDWQLQAAGDYICTNQLMLGAMINQDDERAALSEAFLLFLLEEEQQAALKDAGAFSVSGEMIHSEFSAYAPLDALINSRTILAPDCFSEHYGEDSALIVRSFCQGKISAGEALARMGFDYM